jgi:carbonic anhydrase
MNINHKTNFSHFSRRRLIKYGGGFLGTGLVATVLGIEGIKPQSVLAERPPTQELTPDEALQLLQQGNERFVENKRKNPNQDLARLAEVAEGQTPFAALLGCADSRVPAEIVFDQGLGDLFVCRIAGNSASSQEVGSLEFGTMVLGAKVIVVLGHSQCGAVKAALEGGRFPGQIGSIISSLQVSGEDGETTPGADKLETAIKTNINHQVKTLNQSAVLGELIDKGQLKIVGAYYDLNTGKVSIV